MYISKKPQVVTIEPTDIQDTAANLAEHRLKCYLPGSLDLKRGPNYKSAHSILNIG